jgi:hypothetical protein
MNPNFDDPTAQESTEIFDSLPDFFNQFALIKTPYGYVITKATPLDEMARVRRSRQQAGVQSQLK